MDTSLARRNILARIRAAQGREPEPSAAEREAAADYLARHPAGPRPDMPADLCARFIAARVAALFRTPSRSVPHGALSHVS